MSEAVAEKSDLEKTAGRGRPLRVLLVSSSSGSRGGGELYLNGLAGGLVSLGHAVQFALSDHPRMDEFASLVKVHGSVARFSYRNTYDRRLRCIGATLARRDIKRIARDLADFRPDVIHVNKQNLEDGLDLLLAVNEIGYPVVSTIHVTRTMKSLRSLGGSIRDWVSGRVLRSIACPLIAIAHSGIADLEALKIDPGRLRLVWNGVSGDPRAPAKPHAGHGVVVRMMLSSAAWPDSNLRKIHYSCPSCWRNCREMSAWCGSEGGRCWRRCGKGPLHSESRIGSSCQAGSTTSDQCCAVSIFSCCPPCTRAFRWRSSKRWPRVCPASSRMLTESQKQCSMERMDFCVPRTRWTPGATASVVILGMRLLARGPAAWARHGIASISVCRRWQKKRPISTRSSFATRRTPIWIVQHAA